MRHFLCPDAAIGQSRTGSPGNYGFMVEAATTHCFNDFRYARTASASGRVIRKFGMGGLGGAPVREIPVESSRTNSSSVPGGLPAKRGSTSAQFCTEYVAWICVGPPSSQFLCSPSPFWFHGVWQRPHIA